MIPQIKKILYATDLSKNSSYAFYYALDMARKHKARIVILHAIEPVPQSIYLEGETVEMVEELEEAQKGEQRADIEEITKRLQGFCERTQTQIGPPCTELVSDILVPVGGPVSEILKTADVERCDAIVLGRHGKGSWKETFLGSITEHVLRKSKRPVFVIPLPLEKTDIDWDGK